MQNTNEIIEDAQKKGEDESLGIQLLQKGKNGIVSMIFGRLGLFLVLAGLQAFFTFSIFNWFRSYLMHYTAGAAVFSAVIALCVINDESDFQSKLTWTFLITLMPVFGGILYAYIRTDLGHRVLKRGMARQIELSRNALKQDPDILERLLRESPETASLGTYLQHGGCFPVWDSTTVTYFPWGQDLFEEMLLQIRQARHFIFLEFFIIDEGFMWGKLLQALHERAEAGVEVRVMYDGMCEFSTLRGNYPELMKTLNIRCKMFSPMLPFVSTHYNYRDHRKIMVIDGHTAFTGGVNLADEYINKKERFGVWKDTAVMLKGEAAKSFTLMFLQMWNVEESEKEKERVADWEKYLKPQWERGDLDPENRDGREVESGEAAKAESAEAAGYVIPYGDNPVDDYKVGESVYMDILNRASRYVYIMTPYLILDGEMETALKLAAQRGVDVRLILPGIPDKTIPYALAKGHYKTLLAGGVKIYEYTPGFVHAKVCVSDDEKAVVGTINLDYRSFYHHFECAVYLFRTACIREITADVRQTLSRCRQVTPETRKAEQWWMKALGAVMKLFAPLL